jgi:hypothetical protein
MHDTDPEIARRYRELLLRCSNTERLRMGVNSFEAARAIILASLPKGMSEREIRKELLLRIYGNDLDKDTLHRVLERL